jgi:hypothetical protein
LSRYVDSSVWAFQADVHFAALFLSIDQVVYPEGTADCGYVQ